VLVVVLVVGFVVIVVETVGVGGGVVRGGWDGVLEIGNEVVQVVVERIGIVDVMGVIRGVGMW